MTTAWRERETEQSYAREGERRQGETRKEGERKTREWGGRGKEKKEEIKHGWKTKNIKLNMRRQKENRVSTDILKERFENGLQICSIGTI